MFGRVVEATVTMIIIYYVATHAAGFASLISASASGYSSAVKALQGR
jgi:hypothetical protein